MKKAAIFLLIVIYSCASFGIGIDSFYCCGKLKSVSISLTEKKDVKAEGNGSSCCKTNHQFFKVHDIHVASHFDFHFHAPVAPVVASTTLHEIPVFAAMIRQGANDTHAPPLIIPAPLYILHCDYRI